MQVVRHLYVYFIAAVSLGMLAFGLINLLGLAFEQVGLRLGGTILLEDGAEVRRLVSLYVAITIVALPIWLLHWWLAERAAARPDGEGARERRATVRALYLTLALGLSLIFVVRAALQLIDRGLRELLATDPSTFSSDRRLSGPLAMLLVAGAIWAYHARVRARDVSHVEMPGASAWLPRLYRYAASLAGAVILLIGSMGLIRLILDATLARGGVVAGQDWWVPRLGSGVADTLVGLTVWGAHWTFSLGLLRRDDWRGAGERRSILRRGYLYLVILISVFVTLVGVTQTLEVLLGWLFGVPRSDTPGFAARLLEPVLGVVPFALFWLYHRRVVLAEARRWAEEPLQAGARRLYTYGVSLVGLAFAAVGLAYVLGLLIDRALGGSRTLAAPTDWFARQMAQFLSLAIVGSGAWLWHWYLAQRRVAQSPEAERGATTRRVYLYVTLAASLVAILSSLALIIYRLLNVILNVAPEGGLVSEFSSAVGIVLVAGALLAYHAVALRHDLAARPAAALPANSVRLLLTAPAEADLEATLADLRARLPEGYGLTVVKGRD